MSISGPSPKALSRAPREVREGQRRDRHVLATMRRSPVPHINLSKSLAGAALNLDGVASRNIDAPLTFVQFVTRQARNVPGFGAVEVDCAAERKFMGPMAASYAIGSSRGEAPRRCVESVSRHDLHLGHR